LKKPAGVRVYLSGGWWYVRHKPSKTTIARFAQRPTPEYLASAEFHKLLDRALAGPSAETTRHVSNPKWSVAYAVGFYFASDKFKSLSWFTQRQRRPVLENFREKNGSRPISELTRDDVGELVRGLPVASAQRKLRSALNDMCAVLCDETTPTEIRLKTNPAEGIKTKKLPRSEGWPKWTDAQCEKFENRWPLGTQQRLAYEIMRWTALRIRDAVRLGPEHLIKETVNGKTITMISLIPIKTQYQPLSQMYAPMTPQLQRAIDATPVIGLRTYVVNMGQNKAKSWPTHGQPSNWFKDACIKAGVCPPKGRGCAAHGLRKYRLVELLEQRWSYERLMQLSGHTSIATLERYLRGADRRRMAFEQAAGLWMREKV